MSTDSNPNSSKTWIPRPSDKYLPIWVIFSMTLAVLILSWQMISNIKDICNIKGRCHESVNSTTNPSVPPPAGEPQKVAVPSKDDKVTGAAVNVKEK